MRVLLDMNLPPALGAALREARIECMHWSDIGRGAAPDTELMAWAAANGCVVVTHDLDFSAILAATGAASPSVIQVRTQDVLSPEFTRTLIGALTSFSRQLDAGAILSVDPARARLRILPLSERPTTGPAGC